MAERQNESSGEHWRAALVQTFALLSATSAATRVLRSMHDRRAGRDPTALEGPQRARAELSESVADLQELLVPLFMAQAIGSRIEEGDDRVSLVQRYDALHRAAEAGTLLHRVHQRLMSLYPAVADDLIEEARLLQKEVSESRIEEGDGSLQALLQLLHRTLAFALRLERV